MPVALAASCGTHADKPAVATCRRCGLFLCDACVVLAKEDSYCAACAKIVEAPPPRRAIAAAVLPVAAGLFGLAFKLPSPAAWLMLFTPPLWASGLWFALAERRALKAQGSAPMKNFWLRGATVTLVLSAPALIPPLLFLLWMAFGQPGA
jgi:hypothetical protein